MVLPLSVHCRKYRHRGLARPIRIYFLFSPRHTTRHMSLGHSVYLQNTEKFPVSNPTKFDVAEAVERFVKQREFQRHFASFPLPLPALRESTHDSAMTQCDTEIITCETSIACYRPSITPPPQSSLLYQLHNIRLELRDPRPA